MKSKHLLDYEPPSESKMPDWRKMVSLSLILIGVFLGLLALLFPNHNALWALAGAYAFAGVIARYAS